VSDHQRDLVGSSIMRDFPTIVVNLTHQLATLTRTNAQGVPFLERLSIDEEACAANLIKSSHVFMAEPLYIALQMAGYKGDAHKLVNHTLVPLAKSSGDSLMLVLAEHLAACDDADLKEAVANIPEDVTRLLQVPSYYTGRSAEEALRIAEVAEEYLASQNDLAGID